ncbi:MAG: tetratricopeptide repeat protein [Deltaproteobacteria bacterium]|nr:tetratricopeptide repeat protein [Deltaproteobacteria bacterium]
MFSGQISGIHRAVLILLAVVLAISFVGSAEAARKKKDKDKDAGKSFTVSEQMHKKLTAAHEALEADNYEEAADVLRDLEKRASRLNPYERALIYQMLGMSQAGQEKYKEALVYFEKCLVDEALPYGAIVSTRFTIAQLYMATEEFGKAASTLEKWLKEVETPNANAYYLLAAAYYQLEEVDKAIGPAETAIKIAKNPKPAWLQLLVGLYYETKQFPKAVEPLETLIMIDPKKSYWTQLSSLYAHLEQEEKSLAVMQLAYAQDFLTKNNDLRALAQLYLYHSLPYRAGLVLEKAHEDGFVKEDATFWEMLANSWLLAREFDRALEPLQTGAELSDKGNLYARLGQLYLEREQWAEASEALVKAIEKGGLTDEGTTHLLLAITYYHQKKFTSSTRHLRSARLSDNETIRNSANQWMLLVEREAGGEAGGSSELAPPADEAQLDEPAPAADDVQLGESEPQTEQVSQASP